MPNSIPLLFTALLAFTCAMGTIVHADDKPRTISVSASGSVVAAPDRARIRAGAVTEAESARSALDANAQTIRKVLAGLAAAGVAAKDVQTSRFDVQPVYSRPKTGQPRVIAYRVINQLEVVVREIAKLGDLIDRMVTLGANRIDSIRFEISDLELRKDEARREAMRNAIRRATLFAQAGGASLGEVLRISESASGSDPSGRTAFEHRSAALPAPVAPGQLQLTVVVDVTWALR
jgi:uncharacterized protein